jgi:predicted dehydrogenase
MTTDKIRVGIIGVGWGTIVQTPAFRAVPEYDVVALCSRRPERVQEAGAKLGIDDTSTDWESFVQRDDLDLISICTPTDLHHDQTIAAVQAGKHVLCEKPVALDAAEAKRMLDAAEAAGVHHAVDFEGRWLPDRLAVWDLVRDGFLGDNYLARVTTTADLWHPSHALQADWMYDASAGGGYLMGAASHDIDYLCALFGPPAAICADVHVSILDRVKGDGSALHVTADDTSTVLMRFASGAVASVSVSVMGSSIDRKLLELYGSNGAIEVDTSFLKGTFGPMTITTATAGGDGREEIAQSERAPRSGAEIPARKAGSAIKAMALMLEDWLPAFDGKPAPGVPTLRDGYIAASVIDAAHRSSDGEGWVTLEL